MERDIARERAEPKSRDGISGRNRGDHLVPQPAQQGDLFVGQGKDLFVDETLPRQRAGEAERGLVNRRRRVRVQRQAQQRGARVGEKTLKLDVGNDRGLQQALQQRVPRDGGDPLRAEQLVRGEAARPRVRCAFDARRDRSALLDQLRGGGCEIVGACPRFGQRPHHQRADVAVLGKLPQAAQALRDERLGLRRLAHRKRAPQDIERRAACPVASRARARLL